jgi:hypothetical protein
VTWLCALRKLGNDCNSWKPVSLKGDLFGICHKKSEIKRTCTLHVLFSVTRQRINCKFSLIKVL